MKRIAFVLVFVVLIIVAASPAHADDGQGDRVVFGNDVYVASDESVEGSLVVLGGNTGIAGRVARDVVAFGGNVAVSGHVGGSVIAIGGDLELDTDAVVAEDAVVVGGRLRRDEGSTVRGSVVDSGFSRGTWAPIAPISFATAASEGGNAFVELAVRMVRNVVAALAILAIAAGCMLFFPRPLKTVAATVEDTFVASAGVGLLTSIVITVLTPILAIILVGIPVLLVLWPAYVVATLFGLVATGWMVGRRLCQALSIKTDSDLITILFGLGMLLMVIAPMDAVIGCFGTLLVILILMPGLGAVVLTRFGTATPARFPVSPAAPSPAAPQQAPGADAPAST